MKSNDETMYFRMQCYMTLRDRFYIYSVGVWTLSEDYEKPDVHFAGNQ